MLEHKTDSDLIRLYLENRDIQAGNIIWERYRRNVYAAVYSIFKNYRKWVDGMCIEDVYQEAAIYFMSELLKEWNPEKGKLSGFTKVSIQNLCFYYLKRFGRNKRKWQLEADSIDEPIQTDLGVLEYADILPDESLPEPTQTALHNELKITMESAIKNLPRMHQEIYQALLFETGVFSAENAYLSEFSTHFIQKGRAELLDSLRQALADYNQPARN